MRRKHAALDHERGKQSLDVAPQAPSDGLAPVLLAWNPPPGSTFLPLKEELLTPSSLCPKTSLRGPRVYRIPDPLARTPPPSVRSFRRLLRLREESCPNVAPSKFLSTLLWSCF